MATKVKKKRRAYVDYSLLFAILFLVVFGAIMIYSAGSYIAIRDYNNSMYYIRKQLIIAVIAFIIMFIVANLDYHFYTSWWFTILTYIVSVSASALVMFIGREAKGQKRWFNIMGISFQPAELAKIAVILIVIFCIMRFKNRFEKELKPWLFTLVLVLIPSVLVLFNNLSSAIIIFMIAFVMLYVSRKNTLIFAIPSVIAIITYILMLVFSNQLGEILSNMSFGYRMQRILIWLGPEKYPTGNGYQVLQGLYAIASGGLFGKGLGQGLQKFYLPEAHNDMIFAIICEELGLVGAIVIILLFMFVLFRMWDISRSAKDLEGSLLVVGVMVHIAIQLILNIAVVTNAIPNTGISLPFISYGGSSLVFLMIELGMVFSVGKTIRQDYE